MCTIQGMEMGICILCVCVLKAELWQLLPLAVMNNPHLTSPQLRSQLTSLPACLPDLPSPAQGGHHRETPHPTPTHPHPACRPQLISS